MKIIKVLLTILIAFFISNTTQKSQDYERHIELSLLFYECQRSGPLPSTNRIYWRFDSMTDAGADVGVDLTGGYYDAGDNVKFNFPAASAMTLLAWSGIEFTDAYKQAGQYQYLLDTIKWGADYFIKCHTAKYEYYIGVGNGQKDHSEWVAPEYIYYDYPSYKVTAELPGSEVTAETAAALAAASLLFKNEDATYSATLLKHAIELYDFADTYRGDYTKSVPSVQEFYGTFSGYNDELAWGAAWLYRVTGDETYHEKFKAIADAEYGDWDTKKYPKCTGPITWDDKRPGCYVLIAGITKEEKRMQEAYDYCDAIISSPTTAGGLYYQNGLSTWASNRYAANAASMVAMFAHYLDENDKKRKSYISFVKSQIDYMLGDNPAGVNYVVGAEENSPKAVHHRGASGVYDPRMVTNPWYNIFTLYGALAGGPGYNDDYRDARDNYQMNEVALDYNAGFTICLAALVDFGYSKKDGDDVLDFDRAWPPKQPTPDISVSVNTTYMTVSTGSGMQCSSWCVSFKSNVDIKAIYGSTPLVMEFPNYTICNRRETHFLDGLGNPQYANLIIIDTNNFVAPTEFEVLCDGFHAVDNKDPIYKPENGHKYKVKSPGGPENTEALYEMSKCWPAHVCE